MILEFAKELKARIESEIEREAGVTGRGAARSFEEYKYRVGVYTGLKRTLDFIDDLKRQYNETE